MIDKKKMEKLGKSLSDRLEFQKTENLDMDHVSWIYQSGLLISGNDAGLIINVFEEYYKLLKSKK